MTRKPWFKFDTTAYLGGTATLTLEERGAYVGVLAMLYERDGDLDDNDMVVACGLYVNVRTWRRVKKALVAKGKILIADGKITNRRAAAEIASRENLSSNRVQTEFNRQTKPETFQKTQQILSATKSKSKHKSKIEERVPPVVPPGGGTDLQAQLDLEGAIQAVRDKPKPKPRTKSADGVPAEAVERAITRWAEVAVPAGAKPAALVTEKIREKVRARIKDVGVPGWERMLEIATRSPFLLGKVQPKDGRPPFRASLDWAAGPENFSKIVAGNYEEAPTAAKTTTGGIDLTGYFQPKPGNRYYA